MAEILLLHSALGLRPAVSDVVDRLRALGHDVLAPDYYEGQVFDRDVDGVAHRDAHPEYFDTVRDMASELAPTTALVGFSLGAWFAQRLAASRPQARAAILLHSAAPARGPWSGVPVQVHRYDSDPWIDPQHVASLGAAVRASGALFEDHVTTGTGHLFTDLDLPDGDRIALELTLERIDAFLA